MFFWWTWRCIEVRALSKTLQNNILFNAILINLAPPVRVEPLVVQFATRVSALPVSATRTTAVPRRRLVLRTGDGWARRAPETAPEAGPRFLQFDRCSAHYLNAFDASDGEIFVPPLLVEVDTILCSDRAKFSEPGVSVCSADAVTPFLKEKRKKNLFASY